MLDTATLNALLAGSLHRTNDRRVEQNQFFGACTYKTWVLLLLGHEVDHVRQAIVMRRLARAEARE